MKFTLSLAMTAPDELLALARAAEETGWDAVAMPDSVFFAEEVSADYPYTSDGDRFWDAEVPFVDPFVAIPAMAAVTTRLSFYTNVYKVVLRQPLLVAKMLGSLGAMFEGRIAWGLGLSWMPEEFAWLGQDMRTRGKRLDEIIDVLRAATRPGFSEFHGAHYDHGRLAMSPAPTTPIPLYVGGHSDPALRRAAQRADGWVGAKATTKEIDRVVTELRGHLDDAGRTGEPFEIKLTPLVLATPEAFAGVAAQGVTDVITVPWFYAGPGPHSLDEKLDHLARFARDVIDPLREA